MEITNIKYYRTTDYFNIQINLINDVSCLIYTDKRNCMLYCDFNSHNEGSDDEYQLPELYELIKAADPTLQDVDLISKSIDKYIRVFAIQFYNVAIKHMESIRITNAFFNNIKLLPLAD